MSETPGTDQVRIRRAPKFSAFMIVGGGIGAIVTFILTASFPVDPAVGFGASFAYFCLFGIPTGVVIGGVLALILDRRASKRATLATAEHEVTEAQPEPEPADGESAAAEESSDEAPAGDADKDASQG